MNVFNPDFLVFLMKFICFSFLTGHQLDGTRVDRVRHAASRARTGVYLLVLFLKCLMFHFVYKTMDKTQDCSTNGGLCWI